MQQNKAKKKKKEKKDIPHGIVTIQASFNNTIISVADQSGNVFAWSSTGREGFKGSRRSTPYAAKLAGESVMRQAIEHGLKSCDILVKGPGNGRESSLRAIAAAGIKVNSIADVTPIPHNGCRPPKRRRV